MRYKDDVIFQSMDSKDTAKFTRGDPEKIKFMQEVKANKDMETYVKNNNANNANPGTFNKLVKEDEKDYAKQVRDYAPHPVPTTRLKPLIDIEKTLEKYEDDYVSKRGEQTIALTNTADKLKGNNNKEDYILKEDGNGLMVNKNRTIAVRDSFVAKQFNRALGVEPEASPEQFGALATRLERNRQMEGKTPSKLKDLKDSYASPVQKKVIKKPIKKIQTPVKPLVINSTLPISFFKPEPVDPRSKIMEERFKELLRRNEDQKKRINSQGLAHLMGGIKFD
tara:strand:- start:117 stop:956 length:840 start_codon:yes stop_codon:yes gene_type:complete